MEDNTLELDLFDDGIDIPTLVEEKDEKKEVKKPIENEVIDEDSLDLSEDDEEVIEEVDTDEEDSDLSEEDRELLDRVKSLKEIGALYLPDNYEIESLEKAVQDSEYLRNQAALNSVYQGIPETEIPGIGNARELFKFIVETGGKDLSSFIKVSDSTNYDKFDLDNSEDCKTILRTAYKKKGFSDAKVEKLISRAEDDLELDTEAKEELDSLKAFDAKEKERIYNEAKQAKIKEEEVKENRFNELVHTLQREKEFAGYKIPENAKEGALRNIYREVKLADGTKMSEFDYRMKNIVLQDPKLTLAVSDILNRIIKDTKTGEYKLDLSHISNIEETKATKKLKDAIDKLSSTPSRFKDSATASNKSKGNDWERVAF
jgi:hypothetical protein